MLVGVGVTPRTGLAEAAGLAVGDGILVDATLRTSAPEVYAAGDVASAMHPFYGRHVRVEHWANALNQGPAAARNMLGREEPYDRIPYFFSDLADWASHFWLGGAQVSLPLFQGGRLRDQLRVADLQQQQAVLAYRDQLRFRGQTIVDAEVATDKSTMFSTEWTLPHFSVSASWRVQRGAAPAAWGETRTARGPARGGP